MAFPGLDTPVPGQAGSRAGKGYGRVLRCPRSVSVLIAGKGRRKSTNLSVFGSRVASLEVRERAEEYRGSTMPLRCIIGALESHSRVTQEWLADFETSHTTLQKEVPDATEESAITVIGKEQLHWNGMEGITGAAPVISHVQSHVKKTCVWNDWRGTYHDSLGPAFARHNRHLLLQFDSGDSQGVEILVSRPGSPASVEQPALTPGESLRVAPAAKV